MRKCRHRKRNEIIASGMNESPPTCKAVCGIERLYWKPVKSVHRKPVAMCNIVRVQLGVPLCSGVEESVEQGDQPCALFVKAM